MGFFKNIGLFGGAVSLRLRASVRCADLLEDTKASQIHHKSTLWKILVNQAKIISCPIDKESDWPNIFCQIIIWQLHTEYTQKKKTLDFEDNMIIVQAVGFALSESHPKDTCVIDFINSLPFGV